MFKMVVYNKFMDIMATNANQATFLTVLIPVQYALSHGANVLLISSLVKNAS